MSVQILQGDVRTVLAGLPDDHFDCVVTSPPYYGLRDYGCAGQIGLEPTLDAYLDEMVGVCRGLRRVLKPSGTFWLNIGDSYASSSGNKTLSPQTAYKTGRAGGGAYAPAKKTLEVAAVSAGFKDYGSLKPKDLCLVPNRLALLLQADGWYVRSEIIWHKLNPMPESVTDRPTSSHEKIWLLTKSAAYFYDAAAVAEMTKYPIAADRQVSGSYQEASGRNDSGEHRSSGFVSAETRNLRNVWSIASQPFPGSHFATMPPEIAERCIKAGCPIGGRVLDPFFGAGTTGLVADRLGRDCTGIELNPAYAEMARRRIEDDSPLFAKVAAE